FDDSSSFTDKTRDGDGEFVDVEGYDHYDDREADLEEENSVLYHDLQLSPENSEEDSDIDDEDASFLQRQSDDESFISLGNNESRMSFTDNDESRMSFGGNESGYSFDNSRFGTPGTASDSFAGRLMSEDEEEEDEEGPGEVMEDPVDEMHQAEAFIKAEEDRFIVDDNLENM
ncbi:uncharacterized protein LOC102808618, partial [Saccoglossus kowalevskii]|uniref:Retrotransposon-like protein 1-like n=1 Tax=Saccoglossus kowalevskii TaxID=10224 RepID=A0ABM0ML91_SACKO